LATLRWAAAICRTPHHDEQQRHEQRHLCSGGTGREKGAEHQHGRALVGPRLMKREPANSGPTIDAAAAPNKPKEIGSPAIIA